jgi:hypothetical protein
MTFVGVEQPVGPLAVVLGKLVGVKRCGLGYQARCPAHDDRQASLSVRLGDDGKVLLQCFAGCSFESVAAALRMPASEFFPDARRTANDNGKSDNGRTRSRITLSELAAHKRLPVDFLRSLGCSDDGNGQVRMPYVQADGSIFRTRYRTALIAKEGTYWGKGDGQIAYEPDRGALRKQEREVVLVEGETDTWTLLYAGYPCIGVPGSNATQVLEAHHFTEVERIYVSVEPDDAGTKFLAGARKRIAELGINVPVFELRMPHGAKDPSAYFQRDPDTFAARMAEVMRAARESTGSEPSKPSIELVTLSSLFGPALARATRRREGTDKPIPIQWPAYAEALGGGLWPGAHYLVAGTGVGKSQSSIQMAVHAAMAGVPTIYIGLELEEMQIALRVLGDRIGVRWSSLYLGRCSDRELEAAGVSAKALESLPFYCEFSPARGWPASRLAALCESIRKLHPAGPLLVVLDYLQLVGDDVGSFERRPDTRERISDAAIKARDVARRYGAAVLVISSAARAHYGLLASDAKEAGLVTRQVPGRFAPIRTILRPSVLLGLGKESGETEYSGDSVTVLIRWPTPLPSGETAIVFATPKVRSVGERWCAMAFDGGRFRELSDVLSVDDLPEVAKRGGKGRAGVDQDELVRRVVETVSKCPGRYRSATAIAEATTGTKAELLKAVARATEAGELFKGEDGCFSVRGEEGTNR